MPLYLTIVCLLLSYMYECSLVNLLMEEIKIKKKNIIFCIYCQSNKNLIVISVLLTDRSTCYSCDKQDMTSTTAHLFLSEIH